MEWLLLYIDALIDLSNAMAVYILFGLLFAGVMHEIIPDSLVSKHLGKSNILSVIKATVFGIPLPVCSCGVIPLAASIKKSGASNGATLSFLISTPITGIDSIFATFGMFGWVFTLYRVISSMLIAMIAGILDNLLHTEVPKPAFSMQPSFNTLKPQGVSFAQTQPKEEKKKFSLLRAYRYGFITLLGDIAYVLFLGLLFGALISVAVPDDLGVMLKDHVWLSYVIVILIAVPMYVCATASLPIAAGLILAGVSPGAAFVFLTAGPETNTVTMGVVKQMMGMKTLSIYLSVIVIGSLLFGIGLDYVFAMSDVSVKSLIHMDEDAGMMALISSVVLWGYMLYFLAYKKLLKRH